SVTYIERVGHPDRKHQDQGAKKCGSSGATRKRDNHPTRTLLFVSPQAKSAIRTVRSCSMPKTSRFRSSGRKSPPTYWRKNITAKLACRLGRKRSGRRRSRLGYGAAPPMMKP